MTSSQAQGALAEMRERVKTRCVVLDDCPDELLQAIQIDPDARYLVVFERPVPREEIIELSARLREWWASDAMFLVISGRGIVFERVHK